MKQIMIKFRHYFLVLICFSLMSCNGLKSHEKMCIPEELELGKHVYGEVHSNWVGPSGLDYGLNVYQIDDNTITEIKKGSLSKPTFPSFKEYWVEIYKGKNKPKKNILRMRKFDDWKTTPILKRDKLDDFFGRKISNLKINIPDDIILKINNTLNSKSGLYSFGGLYNRSILLVSLEYKLAFYLYRN